MKKRILKISALILALILIVGVCLFANALVGNPLSKALAKNTAEKHIESTYSDKDFELERVKYSFKDGYYHAYVFSPTSIDSSFTLLINGFGKLKYDNYENDVANGWNTASRIDMDYRTTAKTIFESKAFPYNENIGYGELIFVPADQKDAPDTPDYALITNDLTPDAYYNASELGKRAGKLTVYIGDNNVTAERMAEILLGIRECFDKAGVGFYVIDCVLEHQQDENGFAEDGRIEVMDFRYSDIHSYELTERVIKADKAAKDYYDVNAAEKMG